MSLLFNGTEIEKVVYNGMEVDAVNLNGIEIFTSARAVTYSLTNLVQVSCPTTVKSGGILNATIGAMSGYLTPETISVSMDGIALTTNTANSSYYSYDANMGTIMVVNCTGVINITATTNLMYSTLWNFSTNSVTQYNASANTITIPHCYKAFIRNNNTFYVVSSSAVSGYTNVTKIADNMFYGITTLKNITFPTALTTIGVEAFRGCTNLQSVSQISVTTINDKAFYGCTALVNYGTRAATTVGAYAFYNCSAMTTYGSTPGAVTFTYVGAYAFWNCQGLTGTATENTTIAASTAYSIGAFAFAKTNITAFDLTKVHAKANAQYGQGCFSSNSKWAINPSISTSYNPIPTIINTSTSSSDAGTYKYIFGGQHYGSSAGGRIVSGDYVPDVYVSSHWGTLWQTETYASNVTTGYYPSSKMIIDSSSSANSAHVVSCGCRNAHTDNSVFKSAYANVRYYTFSPDYNVTVKRNETTYTEVGSLTPQHGVAYWWYPFAHVTAQNSGCVVFDTPITLYNGETKMIQDITYKDRLLRFNHDTGEIDSAYCHWIHKDTTADKYYKVTFSDDSFIRFIFPHSMYSLDANCYVEITDKNNFYIGTRVMKEYFENGKPKRTEAVVTKIEIIFETVHFCEVLTNGYFNCFGGHMLISEPLTIGFQNMYGFNEDLTYKSQIRKQYLDGVYPGYLLPYERAIEDLKLTYKDNYGFRAEEWGMLLESKQVTVNDLHIMLDGFVNHPLYCLNPITDKDGDNVWPVTTDNDNPEDIDNLMFKEKSVYILPQPNDTTDFAGWYCSADNRIYQPNDDYIVKFGTHFTARKEV